MPADPSPEIAQLIARAAGRKPYVFVVMPFGSKAWVFERIAKVVEESIGFSCIRADDIRGAGFDLLNKIHAAIERSELVIAEISQVNANVFYEVGYGAGIGKPILLVAERTALIPTDLKGRELILYSEDRGGIETFCRELEGHLRQRVVTQVAILRDMLVAEIPRPVYILASPRHPGPESRITGHTRERRTFGDNLGIVRLLSAFGAIFGDTSSVELVGAQYCADDLETDDINLFLIGSEKVNPMSGRMLSRIQTHGRIRWRFGPADSGERTGDYACALYRQDGNWEYEVHGRKDFWKGEEVHVEDHGLIVRGPHPDAGRHKRMVTILAAAHSLGTAAACYAATDTNLIREIAANIKIAERDRAFWVLVHGIASTKDGLLDLGSVRILETGYCSKALAAMAQ